MEILLIRHAQPAWVVDGIGVNDPGLTELGHDQARLVAGRLGEDATIDELHVSTARRAQETAAPIAEVVAPRAETHEWLHEIRMPAAWDGSPADEIGARMRDARWRSRDAWWNGFDEGGESFRDFHQRIVRGLEAALADRGIVRHPDDPEHLWQVPDDDRRIVVVAHAGTNSVLLGHLLGLEPQPWEWERFASSHASVTVLRTFRISLGHIFSLRRFSDVSHLAPDQVSY
jgi:probable phosphoglycerate mutase